MGAEDGVVGQTGLERVKPSISGTGGLMVIEAVEEVLSEDSDAVRPHRAIFMRR